jgi:hypothetical protein
LPQVVWFPVEVLKIRLTLPTRITTPPKLSLFTAPDPSAIRVEDVMRDGILQSRPPSDSAMNWEHVKWARDSKSTANQLLTRDALQAWELSVPKPALGSCWSLDWDLPVKEPTGPLRDLATSARQLRRKLMEHSRRVRKKNTSIHRVFERFEQEIRAKYSTEMGEEFEVAAMTYDDARQRLYFFEGAVNGQPLSGSGDFSLPFGIGLSGACFKEPDRAFFYDRPDHPGDQPEIYLPIAEGRQHAVLLALPLYHPRLAKLPAKQLQRMLGTSGVEMSRFCIGVMNIGSDSKASKLRVFTKPKNYPKLLALRTKCQAFANEICALLVSS